MYNGFFEVFIGMLGIFVSFFRKNDRADGAVFLKKYNKQILLFSGIAMVIFGTIEFLRKGV
jgi:hypothetical protein